MCFTRIVKRGREGGRDIRGHDHEVESVIPFVKLGGEDHGVERETVTEIGIVTGTVNGTVNVSETEIGGGGGFIHVEMIEGKHLNLHFVAFSHTLFSMQMVILIVQGSSNPITLAKTCAFHLSSKRIE